MQKRIDKLLSVQRPIVLAHLRSIRRHHPDASPEQIISVLERRYLTAVTLGGAAVGASAVLPAVGVGISFALSAVETAGFLESTALFAQSVTEVHGIAVDDPERARTLVMTMMLGSAGSELLNQLAGQATGKGQTRGRFWGELVTKGLPQTALRQVGGRIRGVFLRRFTATQGANIIGRAIPFGIGAVIGGTGNNMLGRKVVKSAWSAFGPPPAAFPLVLEPVVKPVQVRTARARISLPRFGSGTTDSKTPKTPRDRHPRIDEPE